MRNERTGNLNKEINMTARKKEQLHARKEKAEKRLKEIERKQRTRRLILIGATVESALGYPVEEEMLDNLKDYLIQQEKEGGSISRCLKKPIP
jgi:hypothetical protein